MQYHFSRGPQNEPALPPRHQLALATASRPQSAPLSCTIGHKADSQCRYHAPGHKAHASQAESPSSAGQRHNPHSSAGRRHNPHNTNTVQTTFQAMVGLIASQQSRRPESGPAASSKHISEGGPQNSHSQAEFGAAYSTRHAAHDQLAQQLESRLQADLIAHVEGVQAAQAIKLANARPRSARTLARLALEVHTLRASTTVTLAVCRLPILTS
jgi:hypothetical protein